MGVLLFELLNPSVIPRDLARDTEMKKPKLENRGSKVALDAPTSVFSVPLCLLWLKPELKRLK